MSISVNEFLLHTRIEEPTEEEAVFGGVAIPDQDMQDPGASGSRDGPRVAQDDGVEEKDKDVHAKSEVQGDPSVKGLKKPEVPCESEVVAHKLRGHIPFASRCQDCVFGRGQEDPHLSGGPAAGLPVIQFDYGFLGLGEEGSGHLVPMIIGKDRRSGYLGGGVVVRKGDHFYSVCVIDEFFDELGYVSM